MGAVSLNLSDNLAAIEAAKNGSSVQTVDSTEGSQIQDLEFLEMLTTQLKYQDPMNPADNQAFAEQMATMTTMQNSNKQLDMLTEIKKGLEAMSLSLYTSSAAMTNSATVGMINKEVKIATDRFYVVDSVENDEDVTLDIDIAQMDENAEMVITDAYGDEVYRAKVSAILSDSSEGEHTFTWNRMGTDGTKVYDGEYGVNFQLNDANYNGMAVVKQDVVTGVRFSGDTASVTIDGKNYPVERIIEVL